MSGNGETFLSPVARFAASSFSAAVDILASDFYMSTSRFHARSRLIIQVSLSASARLSIIHKNTAGTVLGSCQFQAGSTLNANAAYAWVYAINNQTRYNFQISAAADVTGQIDEARGEYV